MRERVDDSNCGGWIASGAFATSSLPMLLNWNCQWMWERKRERIV